MDMLWVSIGQLKVKLTCLFCLLILDDTESCLRFQKMTILLVSICSCSQKGPRVPDLSANSFYVS